MNSLLYMYDPLCGWCYAATSGISRLQAAGVSVSLLPTGLFCDASRVMTTEFADYAWRNDQRITAMTGQLFTQTYRTQVLQASGTAFDSSAATLALTAVFLEEPAHEAEALRVVQEARYMLGRNITDMTTLRAVLSQAGFSVAAAALASPSSTLLSANAARVARGAAMVRELGGKGVPTLALVEGPARRLFDSQLLYGQSDALLEPFHAAVQR